MKSNLAGVALVILATGFAAPAAAVNINWVDWESSSTSATTGFTATGVITSGSETIDVTYNNPQGVAFFYDGVGPETDYWAQRLSPTDLTRVRDPLESPFTSTGANGVDNIPDGTDMIGLRYAGSQTLTFSQSVGNLVFAFISLNANGYGFDQDFELLSSGGMNIDGNGVDDCGWWGCGTSSKNIDATTGEFQLLGTREPHGALRFTGTFDQVSWRSLSSENWNGFTVGVQGTADQVFPPSTVPLPAAAWMLLGGIAALFGMRARC